MMNETSILFIVAIAWFIIYSFLRQRKKEKTDRFEVGPLYFLLKIKSLNTFLEDTMYRNKRITNPIFTIGAIIACLVAVIGLYSLADSLIKSVVTKSVEPTVAVIIPGVTVPSNLFLIMLPAIIIVLISHELAHKLAAHTYGLKVKSVGLAFFLFIPGAFVEPDEKEFNKSKPSVRMKILAAGSAANLLVGLLFLLPLISPVVFDVGLSPFFNSPSGIVVQGIMIDGPLKLTTDIREGDVIVSINEQRILNDEDLMDIRLNPGDQVLIEYYKKEELGKHLDEPNQITVTAVQYLESGKGIIGITQWSSYYSPRICMIAINTPQVLFQIVNWGFVISLGVATINMLPIYPLDGYKFMDSGLESLGLKTKRKKVFLYTAMIASLTIVGLNIAISYFPQFMSL